ncbi:hypothetical protein [Halobacterium jilantaiense]|uniref:Uncharacterized protein n=1 Tax=Halobacterium jilantaiense TaxID=355548 RepID=A0A1I0MV92_9EURY|nr:hypothetical protein [Halobacterium jilantaiense]SEV92760.1 hypothetical protein SAMN04487945_0407 [Halobacterium jilantaiense]
MRRTVEMSGSSLLYVFYAVSVAGLVGVLAVAVWPLDDAASVAFAVLISGLVGSFAVGAWRQHTGRDSEHLGTAEDIAYDPIAYPGHAAKDRWLKAVRRLPGRADDESDDD